MRVSRRVTDIGATVLAVLVLVAILASVDANVRDHLQEFVSNPQWDSMRGTVTNAVMSGFGVVHGYSSDNTLLFVFTVAACVFVVLMLKVIS